MINKMVIYQTTKSVWICNMKDYNKLDILPIRFLMMMCTDEYISELKAILQYDGWKLIDSLQAELDEDPLTTYTN